MILLVNSLVTDLVSSPTVFLFAGRGYGRSRLCGCYGLLRGRRDCRRGAGRFITRGYGREHLCGQSGSGEQHGGHARERVSFWHEPSVNVQF